MDIVFSSVALLNIQVLTTVNGSICYGILTNESEECPVKYVFTSESTTFIAMKHDGVIHIFNLKRDGVFPDEFKGYIEQIRGKLHTFFKNGGLDNGVTMLINDELNRRDNPHNFAIIRQVSSSHRCKPFIDLTHAKRIVAQLNAALQNTCPGFHLHIDYIISFPPGSEVSLYSEFLRNSYFQPQIVLCLFTGNNCVSSITINVDDHEVSIDSKTNKLYERRKFNTLLRSVAIIISKSLNERVERLVSNALNPISATLMIKYFNAVSRDEEGLISKFTVAPENLDKTISDYFETGGMKTTVELNTENIANATDIFHETIKSDRFNCKPLKGGRKKYTRKVIKKSKKYNTKSKKYNTKSKTIINKFLKIIT